MPVNRLYNTRVQFVDGNGNPANSYRLFFYTAGTSTKQNTYNSSSGAVANSNPITLNSLGQPGVEVWGTAGARYKVGLAAPGVDDPPSAFIWTEDNCAGIDADVGLLATSVSNLLTQVGSYDGQPMDLQGYYAIGDGGAGPLYWSASSTATHDGGLVFKPTAISGASPGRWLRIPKTPGMIYIPDFGSVANGSTSDASQLQGSIDATPAHTLASISGTGGSAIVGGGRLDLSATALGYAIGASVNVTKSKIVIRGPARLYVSAGVTALLWNFIGSSAKSGVVLEYIDFVGGAIAADIGSNADAMPVAFYKCNFINQTTAAVKVGSNGYWIDIDRCRFSGNAKGVWHQGSASDGLRIARSVFIYNSGYDIHLENGANATYIEDNDFVGNLAATPVNIFIDTATAQTGAYSIISGNKFGPESRTAGNPIVVSGNNPLISAQIVDNPLVGFDSSAPGYFIKITNTPLKGCVVRGNRMSYCGLFDPAGTETTTTAAGGNTIEANFSETNQASNLHRGDWNYIDLSEPPPDQKYNILAWSRYVNAGGSFTYTNATPSYMTATDENGVANNATTVTATAANNIIRINSLDTNSTQKKYTLSVWCKLNSAGSVTFSATRGSDAAFSKTISIGTSFQRVVFEFYQTYLAAGFPYVFDITIPNGAVITLGGVCCVPGSDCGDLVKTTVATEIHGRGIFASAAPSGAGIYWPASTRLFNSAPSVGNPKGWVCTVAGNQGTWVSEGNL